MSRSIEERLLHAIEKDDVKEFNGLMEEAQCGSYRLGRFPVLSLLYLYNSRNILFSYEEKFLMIASWDELREPASVTKLFSDKAGKCLRLYLNEVVSPVEMLLILDNTKQLKRVFPSTKPSKAVKARLQSIYSVKYSLNVEFDGDNIILERRPLKRSEKNKIIIAGVAGFLALTIAIATPITISALSPNLAEGEVTKLEHIDFNNKTTYKLKRDIKIPEDFNVDRVNCNIEGNGKKLILASGANLGKFNGMMSNLTIETAGTTIFTECAGGSVIENVTFNVSADVDTAEGKALIAETNYGTFYEVTMNVGGKITAHSEESSGEAAPEDMVFGGFVSTNYNAIANCTVNYNNFSLKGETSANATFGGIVGINNGYVQDCVVTGKITADTFDLAGVCFLNNYSLTGDINEADLSQTALTDGWNPIVSGIVCQNEAVVQFCINRGNLTVTGQETAICGGIVGQAFGYSSTYCCISGGEITVKASEAYVGGIFGMNQVSSDGHLAYCGVTVYCISEVKINATLSNEEVSCIGGVGGYSIQTTFQIIGVSGEIVRYEYYGGAVLNSIFMGEVAGNFEYFGNIVGVCGAKVYEQNSYDRYVEESHSFVEAHNFEGNCYIDNGRSAFGATLEFIDSVAVFKQVEDKGATSSSEAELRESELYLAILEAFVT